MQLGTCQWSCQWDGVKEDTSQWPEYYEVILIRHGEYHEDEGAHDLTPTGMEQARINGKYLQTLSQQGLKIGKIIHSGMLRAEQTAIAINKELNEQKDLETLALLNEGSLASIEVAK